jgi:hypothetical protein
MNTPPNASGDVYLPRPIVADLLDELDTCLCLVSPASTMRIGAAVDLLARLRGKLAAAFTAFAPHALRQARAEGVREGFALAEEHVELEAVESGAGVRVDLAEAARQRDRLLDGLGAVPSAPGMIPTRVVYHLDASALFDAMGRVYGLAERDARRCILGAGGRHGWSATASALPGLTRDKPLTAESFAPEHYVELDEILSDLTDRGELPSGGGDYLVR